MARKAGCSTLVVLSKWDIASWRSRSAKRQLTRRLRQRPPVIAISAKSGRGLTRVLDTVEALFEKHTGRIPTAALNKALGELREARNTPLASAAAGSTCSTARRSRRGRRASALSVNDPSLVTRDYGYWVENELRDASTCRACRSRSTSSGARERRRRRRWLVGHGVRRACCATAGTR